MFGNLLAFYLIYTNVFYMLLLKFLDIDLSWGCINQQISIENSNIYFYNWKKYLKFLNFFCRFEMFQFQFNFTLKTMFTNIFLNIKLLLKKKN